MRNRLILDTDGGVDDAQALLVLIANGRPPDAITTVFGNVDRDQATENILATVAIAGATIPVHAGAVQPLLQDRFDARHVHGEDGLGGAARPAHRLSAASGDAVGFLVAALREAKATNDPIDLLTIGPLTNLALALERDRDIARGIGRLTVMGGTLYGRGNVTPAAEFNILADPEAAAIVLGSPIATTIVPWETCRGHAIAGEAIDRVLADVPESPYKTFAAALARFDRDRHQRDGHGDRLFLIDPLAAAVAVDPAVVERDLSASIGVSLAPGLTRGMTVVDPTGRLGTPRMTLVEKASMDRLHALYEASLAPPAAGR